MSQESINQVQLQIKELKELKEIIAKQEKEIANLKKILSYIDCERNRFFND
jgi:DNA anti-recombination protein RmuC